MTFVSRPDCPCERCQRMNRPSVNYDLADLPISVGLTAEKIRECKRLLEDVPGNALDEEVVRVYKQLGANAQFLSASLQELIFDEPRCALPVDAETRNELPMADGCLDYFPLALAYVAQVSLKATQQHHPGKPMHWDRSKSLDDRNKIMKHLADTGTFDTDGVRHSGKLAWRALANLQKELEAAGWGNPGRASVFPPTTERT